MTRANEGTRGVLTRVVVLVVKCRAMTIVCLNVTSDGKRSDVRIGYFNGEKIKSWLDDEKVMFHPVVCVAYLS